MRDMSYTEALREALREEMAADDAVILLGEDIGRYGGAFGVTSGLLDAFGPERVIATPISEQGFTGVAVGAALVGSRPVIEIMFMDFITLATDQLVNQAAKLHYVFGPDARCPLVVRTAAGGGRCYGPTHSQTLEAWFVHAPGIKVLAPATPADAYGLLKAAIRDDNPVLFIEHKMLYGTRGKVPEQGDPLPIGRARVAKEGADLTIVAWSWMAAEAEAAAWELEDREIDAEVIDLRSLSPMDMDTVLESVRKTGRVMVIDEGCRTGGVGAEIAAQVFEQVYDYLVAPLRRVAALDVPVPASPVLERAVLPGREKILAQAVAMLEETE